MGLLDNLKAFMHSITTEDHYASYGLPYKNNALGSGNVVGATNSSNSRLHELHRLADNSSAASLVDGENPTNNSSSNVGYRPGLRSSSTNLNVRSSNDVPMQSFNASGQPPLPSIDSMWARVEAWLEEEYPELGDNLNDGATTADLNEFENDLAVGSLPVEVRQFYKIHDGQFRGGKPTGLLMGLVLLDIESIIEEYAIWARVSQRLEKQQYILQHQQKQNNDQPSASSSRVQNKPSNSFVDNQKSIPPNSIQPFYAHRGWVPIAKDSCGNQLALDFAPGPAGHWGQVIIFGRDYDTKLVVASSFQEFLFIFVNDLEAGNYRIDQSETNADNGFLDSSRDDDYMIGDEDEEEGELAYYDKDGKEFGPKLRGKLTYLDALKRRSLKKHGITNADNFQTSFIPQRMAPQIRKANSGSSSPHRSQSPVLGNSSAGPQTGKAPLINLDSTSKVNLPKETLIDDNTKATEPVKADLADVKEASAETEKNDAKGTKSDEKITEKTDDASDKDVNKVEVQVSKAADALNEVEL